MSKTVPVLINHRKIAALLGEKPSQVRRWIESGVWPRAHSAVGVTIFYRVADVEHFLKTGFWPEAMLRDDRRAKR